ncbi:MAG TPA: hypothetical protein VD908_20010 [Cytophagales bacterium]|nr:hypothetical protein [Cytophagales bacterium]
MKHFLTTLVILLLFYSKSNGQFYEVFSSDYSNINSWNSNEASEWEIIPNSNVAGGTTNSNTLKLNAAANTSINYLSIQNTANWGTEQTWSFWIGRDGYEATTSNTSYVWLYADKADFTDPLIRGYRIRLGGNTGDGEDIILEYVNGTIISPVIKDNNVVPVDFVNYGLTVFINRSSNSEWTIYTSVSPVEDSSGVNANSDPLIESTISRNLNGEPKFDNSVTNFSNGYFGFMAKSSVDPVARKAAEFDQFSFKSFVDHKEYTWVGSTNSIYGEPTNWNPSRIVKRNTDVLIFNSESTITEVENDIVTSLLFRDNCSINFTTSAPATITAIGTDDLGLSIEAGSVLNISSDHSFTLSLSNNVKGEIKGEISFSGNVDHHFVVEDLEGLSIFGSFIQDCNGNIFGNGTTDQHRVVLKKDAEFVFIDGASPFGNNAVPKVIFEAGSWYRHQSNSAFPTGGCKYANFELNLDFPSSNVTIGFPNNSPMSINNLLITQGGLRLSNSTGLLTINIQESLNVTANGRLEMNLDNKGTSVVNLSGTLVNNSIKCTGKIIMGNTSSLKISHDYSLQSNLTIDSVGTLTLNSGMLNLNGYLLSLADQFTIQKIQGSLSASAENNPNLRYEYGGEVLTGPIFTGIELQDEIGDLIINNPGGVIISKSVALSDSLILNEGKVFSTPEHYITMKVNSKAKGASDLSFVAGPIAKEINSTEEFIFPIGQGDFLRPLGIIPSSSDLSTYLASYNDTPPQSYNDPDAVETPLKSISETEFWNLERITGTANTKAKLFWNERSGISVIDPLDFALRVARLNEEVWQDKGASDHFMESQNNGYLASEELTDALNIITLGSDDESTTFPVTLLNFAGKYENNKVTLSWETVLEINNKGFEVQKSINGIDFIQIGFVPASTSTDLRKTYSFEDHESKTSTYYRLKQLDHNGEFDFSKIVIVNIFNESLKNDQVSPNPFRDQFELELVKPDNLSIKVEIKNTQGISLISFTGSLNEINKELNGYMKTLPSEMYYFTIINKSRISTIKVIKE